MVFKQSFKYLKNEKIIFIKVILKLKCLFYIEYIYIFYFMLLYICRATSTQTNAKKSLIKKKKLAKNKKILKFFIVLIHKLA